MGVDTPIEQLEIGWACGRSQGRLGVCHDTCRYTYLAVGVRLGGRSAGLSGVAICVYTPIGEKPGRLEGGGLAGNEECGREERWGGRELESGGGMWVWG
jgi:hypothetical protein